jgi:hypothetical protein
LNTSAHYVWHRFCSRFKVTGRSVPLFDVSDGLVATKQIGLKHPRRVLCRSAEMEAMIVAEASKAVADIGSANVDGLIYMMLRVDGGKVIPLYIGKAGAIGKTDGKLSVNMVNLDRDRSKFCRWGDNYAYHIGDLSAVVLGHPAERQSHKYRRWADSLFVSHPTDSPMLKGDVRFWCAAWSNRKIGIWEDFGPVGLQFLEYLLIGVAGAVFPEDLLNSEGN